MIHAINKDDEMLLETFLDEDSLNDIPYHEEFWWTSRPNHVSPIAYAAKQNSSKCVHLLLSKGANPDGWDAFTDMTALGIACYHRHTDIAKNLINYGAEKTGLDWNDNVECNLSQDLQVIRDEYIEWKNINRKIAILLLCAKKYKESDVLSAVDKNIVIKIAKYVKFCRHRIVNK